VPAAPVALALGATVAVSLGASPVGVASEVVVTPGRAVGVRDGGGGGSVSRAPGASELHARLTAAANANTTSNLTRTFTIVFTFWQHSTSS
jgi:hypothetical protein